MPNLFIKKSFIEEIISSMEENLGSKTITKRAEKEAKLVKAAELLNEVAEILDESELPLQSEVVTTVLESLAAKKSKKKKKKAKKPAAKAIPTSDEMVANLKHKGWVFNDVADHNHSLDENCARCGDMSYAADDKVSHEEELYSMLSDFKKNMSHDDFEDEWDQDLD